MALYKKSALNDVGAVTGIASFILTLGVWGNLLPRNVDIPVQQHSIVDPSIIVNTFFSIPLIYVAFGLGFIAVMVLVLNSVLGRKNVLS